MNIIKGDCLYPQNENDGNKYVSNMCNEYNYGN